MPTRFFVNPPPSGAPIIRRAVLCVLSGYRAIAYKTGGKIRLRSRDERDRLKSCRSISISAAELQKIYDSEIKRDETRRSTRARHSTESRRLPRWQRTAAREGGVVLSPVAERDVFRPAKAPKRVIPTGRFW